jgi:hypothetical protein
MPPLQFRRDGKAFAVGDIDVEQGILEPVAEMASSFRYGSENAHDLVSVALDDRLEIEGDEGVIL